MVGKINEAWLKGEIEMKRQKILSRKVKRKATTSVTWPSASVSKEKEGTTEIREKDRKLFLRSGREAKQSIKSFGSVKNQVICP